MEYTHLEDKLNGLSSPGIRPGLERLSRLLSRMGHPERSFSVVHILGTNGKGSTAATLESMMIAGGYRTALYTSPHLENLGERLRIDGRPLPAEDWLDCLERVERAIAADPLLYEDPPTYFENLTAIAFLLIERQGVDIALLEAGMGGRYDATNLAHNVLLTLITPIGVDHREFLGNTLSDIAGEKFAAVREGVPAVFSGGNAALEEQFRDVCNERKAIGTLLKDHVRIENVRCSLSGTEIGLLMLPEEEQVCVRTPLIGCFQADNTALACIAARLLSKRYPLSEGQMHEGIAHTRWPGRFEVIASHPPVILDGGHNAHGVLRLVETLEEVDGGLSLGGIVYATMEDKDYLESFQLLKRLNVPVYCTQVPDLPRCAPAAEIARVAAGEVGLCVAGEYGRPERALADALKGGKGVLCCGSLFLVGYLKTYLSIKGHFKSTCSDNDGIAGF